MVRERESERGAEIDKQTDRQGQLREKSVLISQNKYVKSSF